MKVDLEVPWFSFEEDIRGVLEKGRLADIAVLSDDYFALLTDLEAGFDAKRAKLLDADRTELDIEIEVLRDRMKRDGIMVQDS